MLALTVALTVLGSLSVADGTILVLENSHPIVEAYTRSEVSHVGVVITHGSQPIVYEATPSVVRKLPLDVYYQEIGDMNRRRDTENRVKIQLYQPTRPYSDAELTRLRQYLESQLGRRYSVRGYLRKRPGDGIHCAEMVSTALTRTGRYQFPPQYTVSPGALVAQIQPTHAVIQSSVPVREAEGSWCQRSWAWWDGFFDWCGWACWETLVFCR